MPRDPARQPAEHPRLDALLAEWVEWQRSGELRELKTRTTDFWSSGRSHFDDMVRECDITDATIVDAIVWSLPPVERAAIMHVHLQAVWRTNREPLEDVYLRARLSLSRALLRRGVP